MTKITNQERSIIYAEMISSQTVEVLTDKLKQLTIEEIPFFKPKGIYFLGKITGSKFNLITFNAPPIDIAFTITDTSIHLKYTRESLSPTITGVTYALGFPLAFALFLFALLSKSVPAEGVVFLFFFLSFPFFLNKILKYFYTRFILQKDDHFFSTLEQLLDVKIKREVPVI